MQATDCVQKQPLQIKRVLLFTAAATLQSSECYMEQYRSENVRCQSVFEHQNMMMIFSCTVRQQTISNRLHCNEIAFITSINELQL